MSTIPLFARIFNQRLKAKLCTSRFQIEIVKYNSTKSEYTGIKPLRRYILSSYEQYVQNYETALESRFPAAMRIYRVFKIGVKDFVSDMKGFISIVRKVNTHPQGLESLSRKELELYLKMPRDMTRVAPVLLISALPLANYIMFPLAYMFPRHLLSSHFWSLQQRVTFAVTEQRARLKAYKPVFRCLQARVKSLKDEAGYPELRRVVALLGSGLHPSSEQILACRSLFTKAPYDLSSLTSAHVRGLLRMHNMHLGWRRRKRLLDRAKLIYLMDMAIIREGGVTAMTQDEVRMACFIRGLNPTNTNREETVLWLTQWVDLSRNVSEDNYTFILHLPILTAYNHPSNWVLIH